MPPGLDWTTEESTHAITGCAMKVHSAPGPGLLESAYRARLKSELSQAGLFVGHEVSLPIHYGPVELEAGYRLDLVVEGRIVLERKSVNVEHLRDGIRRLY